MRVGGPGGRDAEELLDVAAGEEGPVELFELADGVGDGEEPPGLGGHPRSWSTRCTVRVGTIQSAHVFRHVSRRFYIIQDPGPFFLGSHKGSYGTLGRARPASAAAQGLADLGGPRRADGRRDGRPPPPGPGTIGLCRLRCRRAARAPGFKRNLFAPPPAPSSRQRGGISWRDRRLDTGPFVGRPH